MDRLRLLRAMPALVLAAVVVADLVLGSNVVLGLVVMAPLLAGSVVPPRGTAVYAALALAAAVLLGFADQQYTEEAGPAQALRLGAVVVGSAAALIASRARVDRENRLVAVTRVAHVAQRTILLPMPSPLAGVDIAVHYESAAAEAMLGGDLYGAVVTDDRLRLIVGDVRGKGLDGVRLAAQVLAAFRERAAGSMPLHVLADHLDSAVARIGAEEDFVTAVLVEVVGGRRLTVVNAGHPPPLLNDGEQVAPLRVHPPQPPLGLGPAACPLTAEPGGASSAPGRVPGGTLDLGPHARLLLYTDGLIEARRGRDRAFLPLADITAALAASRGVPEDVDVLRRLLLQWVGKGPSDDVALVAIGPTGSGQG